MTKVKGKAEIIGINGLLERDTDFLRASVKAAVTRVRSRIRCPD